MAKLNPVRLKGLKKVEIQELGKENAEWVELGMTTPDSFVITKSEDSVTEEFIEETGDAIDEITTQKGVREITWSTKNVSKDVFMAIAGGTINGKIWEENPALPAKEVSIKVESENGITVTIARAKIRFTGDLKFSKNALSQLTIKAKQLAPETEGAVGFQIEYPA